MPRVIVTELTPESPARLIEPVDSAPSEAVQGRSSLPVGTRDLAAAVLLFAATTVYVALQPRNLSGADESVYLYEAKRVFEGQVLYRDVFEITTPGWIYLMAALFGVFGVKLATARLAMAVVHGLTTAAIYATGRRLGIRWSLSWLPAFAYLLVCQPAWPIASQHWLGTFLTVLLLLVCARVPGARAAWALLPGVIVGLVVAVHQQRGVFVGAGIVLWLIVDHALRRYYAARAPRAALAAQLAWLVGGAALVIVPLCIVMLASAGVAPVWQALVIHPLFNYRSFSHAAWGKSGGLLTEQGSYTFPVLLKYLPLVLAVDLVRLGVRLVRRQDLIDARRLALLLLFGITSILSIAYFPDFIHIAFIAPVFFVAWAECVERVAAIGLHRLPVLRTAGVVAAGVTLVAGGLRLQHNFARSRAAYPISRETAFGRVDWHTPFEAQLYDTVRELMNGVPSRELFCYPILSSLYLTVDADNPTRFQFLLPAYSGATQMQEVVETLRQRKLPYIVAFTGFLAPDDPVLAYLQRDYEPLGGESDVGKVIFRRKPDAGRAEA